MVAKQMGLSAGVPVVGGGGDSAVQTRWMVGLALLISFVGILNAMVLNVTERFREIAETEGLNISTILITHGHSDHTGGADRLKALTGAVMYGDAEDMYVARPIRTRSGLAPVS